MTRNNPFSNNNYDLGVGNAQGLDIDTATEDILRTAYSSNPTCYVCNYNVPQYQVMAKEDKYNSAQIQNGLYLCGHCISLHPVDTNMYGLRALE